MSLARDELHLAMGEFLTECSNLENILISLMMFCQDRRDFQLIHLEMLGETFGNRIKAFKSPSGIMMFFDRAFAA